jgi:hypothetical protein
MTARHPRASVTPRILLLGDSPGDADLAVVAVAAKLDDLALDIVRAGRSRLSAQDRPRSPAGGGVREMRRADVARLVPPRPGVRRRRRSL